MKPEDDEFVDSVASALLRVREANVVRSSHSISFGDEQPVEASVVIDREAIRNNTGRDKVRDVVIDSISEKLERKHGLEVTRTTDNKLVVKTVPMHRESEFKSFDKLMDGAIRAKKYIDDCDPDE
ncbi:hypothetical protein [Vogesella indigofera]|uniref:hypothetical protein n=1 Tax=Vogesella indigofera TaxID=45465 RepID=UPI003F430374